MFSGSQQWHWTSAASIRDGVLHSPCLKHIFSEDVRVDQRLTCLPNELLFPSLPPLLYEPALQKETVENINDIEQMWEWQGLVASALI